MINNILLICIGNDLRGDDGFASELGKEIEKLSIMDILYCVQLVPEIAETIIKYEIVIFADAKLGDNLGRVEMSELQAKDLKTQTIGHHQTPEFILALSSLFSDKTPKCYLLTMQSNIFDLKESLSEFAKDGVQKAIKLLQEFS
ncbi:MAG: hypothetical protein RL154_252 [Pseudomonadota bacterium]